MNRNDVTVVIRATDERTEEMCKSILTKYFGESNVFMVKNISPFSKAIEKSFLIGCASNKKWTLIVDADIIIDVHNLDFFLEFSDGLIAVKKDLFSIDGMIYDKFWSEKRYGGPHLYNSLLLKKALKYIGASTSSDRPETFIKERMKKKGHPIFVCDICVGLHDFGQYYESIFRKGVLHAKKHANLEKYLLLWKNRSVVDRDFFWLVEGVEIGLTLDEVVVDYNFFSEIISRLGIVFDEQPPIDENEINESMNLISTTDVITFYEPFSAINKILRRMGLSEIKFKI